MAKSKSVSLGREQLLGAVKAAVIPVEVPELGGHVNVRPITVGEVMQISGTLGQKYGDVPLIMLAVVDEDGGQVFGAEDLDALMKLPLGAAARILAAIREASGLTETGIKAVGAGS